MIIRANRGGFTLVEVMIGLGISSILFAILVFCSVNLTRMLVSSDQYAQGMADEQRAMDYISRDIRAAYAASATSGSLTVVIPDCYNGYYDDHGHPPSLSATLTSPVLVSGSVCYPTTVSGTTTYGGTNSTLTVTYYTSTWGNALQLVRKQVCNSTGSTSHIVISNVATGFGANYISYPSTSIAYSGSFQPQFLTILGGTAAWSREQTATVLTGCSAIRNDLDGTQDLEMQ